VFCDASRGGLLLSPQLWIKDIAQPITEEIDTKNRNENR
jgi:hypothetical protein